jgi:23S rRNA (cytidine1920-2'-O)/16S rRNA (cytidine1409-2'-O)-methyltransferase
VTASEPRDRQPKRRRLDLALVERGLARSREEAQRRILAGEVRVCGRIAAKASETVSPDAEVRVEPRRSGYVSRGGDKLAAALDAFAIDPAGLVALDVGASTGGFTDCLLRRGAARVYALDVGYGQLAWSLRNDPRVVVIERQNVRELPKGAIPEPVDLATIDVSFISLRLVLPKVVSLLAGSGRLVALVKPQFEVGKGKVGKGGVVRDPALHREVVEAVRAAAGALALAEIGEIESPLVGPKGNREFLLGWRRG